MDDATGGDQPVFACKCLNVRIHARPRTSDSPNQPEQVDADYRAVYVADQGITVLHNQLTLRTRSRAKPAAQFKVQAPTPTASQYTTVSCLVCNAMVYRVVKSLPAYQDGAKDGPVLPTEDWTEKDTLQSITGWIEVHKDCLNHDAVVRSMSSPSFSSIFSLVLPASETFPFSPTAFTAPPPSSASALAPADVHLPPIPPVLPPPPFTPSHAVFNYLASIVSASSQLIRASAEEELRQMASRKVAEIEQIEQEMRREVELLWRTFRGGLRKVVGERSESAALAMRLRSVDMKSRQSHSTTPGGAGTPTAIRDFSPVSSPPPRMSSSSVAHAPSALSASFISSSFHRARAQETLSHHTVSASLDPHLASQSPAPPYASHPSSLTLDSDSLGRSASEHLSLRGDVFAVPGAFRRNMDPFKDTVASFRYTTIETEMAQAALDRTKRKQREGDDEDMPAEPSDSRSGNAAIATRSPKISSAHRKNSHSKSREKKRSRSGSRHRDANGAGGVNQEIGKKGKRKVTFDVNPEVVTIKREVIAEQEQQDHTRRGSDEMIFELDDEDDELTTALTTLPDPVSLPLQSSIPVPVQSTRPQRHRRIRSDGGLPESFLSLRPVSLPILSNIRPPQQRPLTSDTISNASKRLPKVQTASTKLADRPLHTHEAEILKLVAAENPSHRGAWTRGGKALELFQRQRGSAKYRSTSVIEEEDEESEELDTVFDDQSLDVDDEEESDYHDQNNIPWSYKPPQVAASLPVSIAPIARLGVTLSYQPKSSRTRHPGELVPPLPTPQSTPSTSAAASRMAVYAERDRSRSMDPGALDFTPGNEEGSGDSDCREDGREEMEVGIVGRGRKRALKILQKRSEVPAAGMWRSLA